VAFFGEQDKNIVPMISEVNKELIFIYSIFQAIIKVGYHKNKLIQDIVS